MFKGVTLFMDTNLKNLHALHTGAEKGKRKKENSEMEVSAKKSKGT